MFLRCSYFFGNLSLNVLINMVLTQKKECRRRKRMRSEAEEEEETDSFVFGDCCGLTSDSPAAALPLSFLSLQLSAEKADRAEKAEISNCSMRQISAYFPSNSSYLVWFFS